MIPKELDFRHLKRLVSIEQLLEIEGLGRQLRRQGNRLVGPCPLHGGDNPRAFVVSLGEGLWHCWTGPCGGGDAVELVRCLHDLDYRNAAQHLARLARPGHLMHEARYPRPPRPHRQAFRPFTRELPLQADCAYLRRKGILPDTARRFHAGRYLGTGLLAGCVGVRLHDPHGNPLGYAGRRLDPGQAASRGKWVFPPRLPKRDLLYNYHRLRGPLDNGLVLVECPWSVMRLAQLHIPALGLLGTELSTHQRTLLPPTPRFILLLDGDAAGQRAAQNLARLLGPSAPVHPVPLPQGFDPDDLSDAKLLEILGPFFPF